MINSKLHLPPGTQDFLPQECAHKREIEATARQCFLSWGYDEIETPCMEYFDVFQGPVGGFEQENMFKLSDASGRLLVLRPDLTTPLARVAATRREESILRMFYVGNAFQFAGSEAAAGAREFTQTGVELMGQSGPLADAEAIALAITVLKSIGLRDFQIDIGQVQFFKGMMEEAGLTPAQAEEVRRHVEDKNMLAIEMLMQSAGVSGSLRNRILELPALYGGPEVLDTAAGYTGNALSRAAVNSMRETLEALSRYGLDEYVSIDLGMVQGITYYSSIIFRGISRFLGYPLLTGGRYDGLVGDFGRPLSAVGFAFAVKSVLIALERQGALPSAAAINTVAMISDNADSSAFQALDKMRETGRVEQFYGDLPGLIAYAQNRGARKAVRWSGSEFVTEWERGAAL